MPWINKKMNRQQRVPTIDKKAYQEIYQDPRWKSIRDLKRKTNPFCEACMPTIRFQDETHHIIPWQWGRNEVEKEMLAFDLDNTRSLCMTHHKQADEKCRKFDKRTRHLILNAYFDSLLKKDK